MGEMELGAIVTKARVRSACCASNAVTAAPPTRGERIPGTLRSASNPCPPHCSHVGCNPLITGTQGKTGAGASSIPTGSIAPLSRHGCSRLQYHFRPGGGLPAVVARRGSPPPGLSSRRLGSVGNARVGVVAVRRHVSPQQLLARQGAPPAQGRRPATTAAAATAGEAAPAAAAGGIPWGQCGVGPLSATPVHRVGPDGAVGADGGDGGKMGAGPRGQPSGTAFWDSRSSRMAGQAVGVPVAMLVGVTATVVLVRVCTHPVPDTHYMLIGSSPN